MFSKPSNISTSFVESFQGIATDVNGLYTYQCNFSGAVNSTSTLITPTPSSDQTNISVPNENLFNFSSPNCNTWYNGNSTVNNATSTLKSLCVTSCL